MAAKNGADLPTIKFTELPQTAMAAAVARGTVAGATTTEPNLAAALDDVRVLGYVYDAIGNPLQVSGWFATEDWIRANPDVARRFVSALHEAAVWGNNPANHAASAAILQKYTPFSSDLIPKLHRASYGEVFDTAIIQPLLDAARTKVVAETRRCQGSPQHDRRHPLRTALFRKVSRNRRRRIAIGDISIES